MKKIAIISIVLLFSIFNIVNAQSRKSSFNYKTPKYSTGYYKTTGYQKVSRSSSVRSEFLKSQGYKKVPIGYEVDHVIPLSKGGSDSPYNMQLITKEQHHQKTARERKTYKFKY